jgi:hypothetical protein
LPLQLPAQLPSAYGSVIKALPSWAAALYLLEEASILGFMHYKPLSQTMIKLAECGQLEVGGLAVPSCLAVCMVRSNAGRLV